MIAEAVVNTYGDDLVGRTVFTEPVGEYPGGFAEVTELAPDEAAPEIVCQVNNPCYGEIGIFWNEELEVV